MSRIGELIPRETHERIVANARIAVRSQVFANHSEAAHTPSAVTPDCPYDTEDIDLHDYIAIRAFQEGHITLESGPKPGKEVTPNTQ